jgi:hypothetical protein
LLACALADPAFISMFTELAAPVEAPLLPAFLDLGAAQMTAARWSVVAKAVNRKANNYENDFASLKVGTHGYVLADIDPKKGSFVETPYGEAISTASDKDEKPTHASKSTSIQER